MKKFSSKTTIYLHPQLKKRVLELALERDWGLSKIIEFSLRKYIKDLETEQPKMVRGPKHPDQQLSDALAEMGMDIYDQPWNFVPRPTDSPGQEPSASL